MDSNQHLLRSEFNQRTPPWQAVDDNSSLLELTIAQNSTLSPITEQTSDHERWM